MTDRWRDRYNDIRTGRKGGRQIIRDIDRESEGRKSYINSPAKTIFLDLFKCSRSECLGELTKESCSSLKEATYYIVLSRLAIAP